MLDFKELKYRIDLIPKEELVIEHIPELVDYKEFSNKENDMILRIAFLATDEGSPFLKKDRDDYEKRINAIFDYLKIDNKGLLEAIIINKNKDYSLIVNRFFILCDNLAYVMWSNMLFNFHLIGVALRQPPDMDNMIKDMDSRSVLQKKQKEIHEDLVTYEAKIFSDTATRKMVRKEVSKIIQMPEHYAKEKGLS